MLKTFLHIMIFFLSTHVFAETDDWTSYGKDSGGGHFSKANEITPENVKNLKKVWEHRSGDYKGGANSAGVKGREYQTSFQATPLLVDNTLFYCTNYNRVFALNPETGEEKWVFDPKLKKDGRAILACRGLSSWKDETKLTSDSCYHRIMGVTVDAELFSIDAKNGQLCEGFGKKGRVDLRKGLGEHPAMYYWSTSPPAIINDKIVVGGSVLDNASTDIPGGVVRAYDVRTGDLIWFWDPIPPDEATIIDDNGNPLYRRGTANVWSIISADPDLNMVYLPTGNASPDYYGGHREGLEEYSSSVVALNADTGKLVWSFQTVHHDIWDYDVPSQPTFYECRKRWQNHQSSCSNNQNWTCFFI